MNSLELAKYVDHTLLKPEATNTDIMELCAEALQLGTYSVCVSPTFVEIAKAQLHGQIKVATVCGFPSGKHQSSIKAMEATLAVQQGADEVDMVIDVGRAVSQDWSAVEADISAVRMMIPDAVLKVILETAALSDEQIEQSCLAAQRAGADFVKTSTGFHPAGGVELRAIKIMQQTVGGKLGIKASGGIRTAEFALELIAAGATRLGLSSTRAVLAGATTTDGY
ncbi:MAG: deoxyribose-phosphate aldolase [Actinobacteria bacterium]|nr:deoxyribose-phosphate aldolase [Actinomycetota bacterium]NBY15090.1 deoxyribose-phosphate aldolase [Actinomycetota bacterium]